MVADITHEEAAIGPVAASLAVAVPASVYLMAAWLVTSSGRRRSTLAPIGAAVILLVVSALVIGSDSASAAVLAMGLVVAGLVGATVYRSSRPATASIRA